MSVIERVCEGNLAENTTIAFSYATKASIHSAEWAGRSSAPELFLLEFVDSRFWPRSKVIGWPSFFGQTV
ncbi:MAG TPA: hypothetical protein VLZ10_01520 [Thermodesulfobacteriota bacterium]|nr:hypothetical protein [Thermodesulfobacteriota bacterium]